MSIKSPSGPPSGFNLGKHLPSVHHEGSSLQARQPARFRVVRSSIGIKLGQGFWPFKQGDRLAGVLVAHPVNASRKVIIATAVGTFNLNEEDLEEL